VLRQNSMRTENGAIHCRDGCLIQVIPSPSNAKILSGGTRAVYLYIRMEEPGRFHDATLVRIRQLDRTGGAALPVADEKGRDRRQRCEFFQVAFVNRDDVIQEITPATPYPTLCDSILPRTFERSAERIHPQGSNRCGDLQSILGITIKDDEPRSGSKWKCFSQLLHDP
jgi:hypothetical protein